MATNPNKSLFLDFNNVTNPYRLHHGDNHSLSLIHNLFNIVNYTTWSRAMRQALCVKNKLGFINGSLTKPEDTTNSLDVA